MFFKVIIKLMDIKTLVAGIIPVILGSVFSIYAFGKCNVVFFILSAIAMLLVQSSTNMINDYFDYKRGADSEEKSHEKVLVSGEITPRKVLYIIIIYLSIAIGIGVFIASQTSWYILLVTFTGIVILTFYAFGPLPISYTPLGEFVSGVTMGVGITTSVIYIHSGIVNLNTILVALPTSLFIGTILLSNNLSDLEEDRKVGRKTLPILIGVKNAERLWVLNVIMLPVLTFVLVLIGILPIIAVVTAVILFPFKSIPDFLSYKKNIQNKGRTMGLIGKVGLIYHLALIAGLLISIFTHSY